VATAFVTPDQDTIVSEIAARTAYAGGWPGVLAELKIFAEGSET
jgi:hypothetical protein